MRRDECKRKPIVLQWLCFLPSQAAQERCFDSFDRFCDSSEFHILESQGLGSEKEFHLEVIVVTCLSPASTEQ